MATLLPCVISIDPTIVPMKGGNPDDIFSSSSSAPPKDPAEVIIEEAIKTAERAIKDAAPAATAAEAAEAKAAAAAASSGPSNYSITDVIGYMDQLKNPLRIPVAQFTVTVSQGSIPSTESHAGLHETLQGLFQSENIGDAVVDHPYTFGRPRVADPNAKTPPTGPTISIGSIKSDNRYTIRTVGDSIEVQYAITSEPTVAVAGDPAERADVDVRRLRGRRSHVEGAAGSPARGRDHRRQDVLAPAERGPIGPQLVGFRRARRASHGASAGCRTGRAA